METPVIGNEITALCVILVVNIVWDMLKNRTKKDDSKFESLISTLAKNTEAHLKLENRLARVESDLASLPRMKDGIRKIFNILRFQAGADWSKMKDIMEDDLKS